MYTKINNKIAKTFSKNLIKFRKTNNLSQQELGKLSGISQRMIAYYEDSPNSISIEKIENLAKILKISISDLFEDEVKSDEILNDVDIRWLKKLKQIKNMPDYEQRIIWNHINSTIEKYSLKKQLQESVK
jgi:transcriptional regulator with XRE-family HTH domain